MIRSVLLLEPKSGDYEGFLGYFKSARVLERSLDTPGCLSAEIQAPVTRRGPVLVTALWASAEAYELWVGDPWRAFSRPELEQHLAAPSSGPVRGELYVVVHAVSAE